MQKEEVWKTIEDYEKYEVSNLGRVRMKKRGNIKATYIHENKYLRVSLAKNNKPKWFKVHRLVAIAFIPNPDNKKEVNHKDLDKLNNYVDNLEWVSGEENRSHYLESDKYKKYLKSIGIYNRIGSKK